MSRVAKAPVILPKGVEVSIQDGFMCVKGPKGEEKQHYNKLVNILFDDAHPEQIKVEPAEEHPHAPMHAGTVRANLSNMVKGVTTGFTKELDIVGVGYRAQITGRTITLSLGFSHPVEYHLPQGINAEAPSNTSLIISGTNKERVGQVAAEIRAFRSPEPYKGKGVKYKNENIQRKEPKKK